MLVLGVLFLEVLVDLAVGLRDFLGCLGAPSGPACGFVFRYLDFNDLGPTLRRQVHHLGHEGGVLEDGLVAFLFLPVEDLLFLDPIRVPGDVLAALDLAAAGQVVEVEEHVVLQAPVAESKGYTRAVFRGRPHHVGEQLGDVHGAALLLLRFLCLLGAIGLVWRPFRVMGPILAIGRSLFAPGLLAILTKLAHRRVALGQGVLVLGL